jgi:hypothetical protein
MQKTSSSSLTTKRPKRSLWSRRPAAKAREFSSPETMNGYTQVSTMWHSDIFTSLTWLTN